MSTTGSGDSPLSRATVIAALIGLLGTVLGIVFGNRSGERRAGEETQTLEARLQQQETTIQAMQTQLSEKDAVIRSLENRIAQQDCEGPGGGSVSPVSQPLFETESYRLIADGVRKSGNTVRVTMVLEATGEGGVEFHAGDWYLLDENGERWNELSADSPSSRLERERELSAGVLRPFRDKIRLVSGTKAKDSLVFSATGSDQGTSFTLIGVESDPQSRREIVLRGLVAGGS